MSKRKFGDYREYTCESIDNKTGKVCGKTAYKGQRKRKDGTFGPRTSKGKVYCSKCFQHHVLTGTGHGGVRGYQKYWNENKHPYLRYRKNYCENTDSRLGFKCTYEPPSKEELKAMGLPEDFKSYLQVDHIDGNPYNHNPKNLQTLCGNCHSLKTAMNRDRTTPGRKTRKNSIKKINGKETYVQSKDLANF